MIRQIFIGRGEAAATTPTASPSSASSTSSAGASRTPCATPTWRSASMFYVPPSFKTLIYKGMLNAGQLGPFYPDLTDPDVDTALALVHSRFSTNTFPTWARAHPYRYIAHNGEINTLRGNVNWMTAREHLFASDAVRRRHEEDAADHRPERQRLGDVRQRPGIAGPGRPVAAARGHDDDPGAVERRRDHERGEEGVLRISLLPDGAVGRPGVDRLHRRHAHRRRARPQRPAAVALLRHQGRPGHHGVRGRRARHPAGARAAQGPPAAGPHVPGRSGAGPHHRRRRDQAARSPPSSPTPSGCATTWCRWSSCRPARARTSRTTRRCCCASGPSATPPKT